MRKMRKIVSVLLSVALIGGMFSGCSKSDKATDNEASTPTTGAEVTEAAADSAADSDGPMTISVMGVDWGYGPKQNSSMEQYWEEYMGVNLDVEWVSYTDYNQKLNTLLSSGKTEDIPDVIQIMKTENSFYYPVFAQAIDAGTFVDLTPYLNDGLAKNNKIMSTWPDKIWQNATYNGGIYILPRSTSEVALNSGIEVRRDLMEQYGFTKEPTTMDELKDWLIGLSKASGLYGLEFSTSDIDDNRLKAFAVAFTGMQDWGLDANGNFQYYTFSDGYIDFLNWMKDLYSAGAIDPEFILNQTDNSKWKAGKSVAFLSTWYNWNQSETNRSVFDDAAADVAKAWCIMPVKGTKQYSVNVDDYGFNECIAINANCSDEKIKKILEVFNHTEDDYFDVLKYGVEGMHYSFDANKNRVQDDAQKTAAQEGYVGAWNQIFLKTNADMINDKFVAKNCTQEYIDRAQELKDFTEKVASESDLATKNLNLISPTYSSTWSTLTADLDDMRAKYIMGEIGVDEWNSYADSIVNSDEYKSIIAEYKEAAANK